MVSLVLAFQELYFPVFPLDFDLVKAVVSRRSGRWKRQAVVSGDLTLLRLTRVLPARKCRTIFAETPNAAVS